MELHLHHTRPDVSKRVLDPSERTSELLFGLIMVLTFTGSLSVAQSGRADVRDMLIAALGCNLAWGIIDAVFYLMGSFAERSADLTIYRTVRGAASQAEAHALIAEALPPVVAAVLRPSELAQLSERVCALPEPPPYARLTAADWRGATAVCLLVFLSTFPVALPFMVIGDAATALRLSNAIAVLMLFVAGIAYGRAVGRSQLLVGLGMVGLGGALVAITIALGG
jgi:VIT1/CCC1 family predicted Fe2+/Mn2+ transporter